MRHQLIWKFLGINFLVIGVVILSIWLAIDYLAADYYLDLMKRYDIDPKDLNRIFLGASHRYLVAAGLAALGLAAVLCTLLTRRVLRPLGEMSSITRSFAAGDYSARAYAVGPDPFGQLASAFNQMADSLQRVEGLRKAMVADVAHELRTPLTNIRGYLEALGDGVLPPSRDVYESMHEEALRLAKLVEDLLQLSRADAARTTLRRAPVDLPDLVSQAIERFRLKFEAKRVDLKTDLAAGDVVPAEADRVTQILTNILHNAWQYTPEGGSVRVVLDRPPGWARLIIANTGEGIAEDDLPFIFERFYRGEKSRSRAHGGAGIGLAIVKELVEAHGGQLGAENAPAGAVVWFCLPAW